MNGCMKCFIFLLAVAVFATFIMIHTSSDSETNMLITKDYMKGAIAKASQHKDNLMLKAKEHKDRIKDVISQQYNALIGDSSAEDDGLDGLFNSGPSLGDPGYNSDNGYNSDPGYNSDSSSDTSSSSSDSDNGYNSDAGGNTNSDSDNGVPDYSSDISDNSVDRGDNSIDDDAAKDAVKESSVNTVSSPTTAPVTTSPTTSSTVKSSSEAPTPVTTAPSDNTSEEKTASKALDTKALLDHIHVQCKKYGLSTQSPFDNPKLKEGGLKKLLKAKIWPRMLIGSYKHRLIYSSNPKCGSTSFKKFLLRVHGDATDYEEMGGVHAPKKHENWKQMAQWEKERIIKESALDPLHDEQKIDNMVVEALKNDFYKVGFIRNPFTRVISGFRDKILRKHQNKKELKADIKHDDPTELEQFYSFVKLITTGVIRNLHYMPQFEKMKICTFPYDMLGQVETTDEQIPLMQEHTGLSGVEFPGSRSQTGADSQSTQDLVRSFYSGMPPDILAKFYQFYKMDFELMGYTKLEDPDFPYIVLPNKQLQL